MFPRVVLAFALILVFSATPARAALAAPSQPVRAVDSVPARAPAPLFGFNDGAMRRGQVTPAAGASLLAEAGAGTVRITVDWRNLEPVPGTYLPWQLASYDAIYAASVAKGVRPIMQILFSPAWSWDVGVICAADCKYPPSEARDADWKRLITMMVRRYPQMAALEVWNEPNLAFFWGSGADPERYGRLVASAFDAARAANPSVKVIAGSAAPAEDTTATRMETSAFTSRAWAAGMKDHVDGVSVHPYPLDVDDGRFHKELAQVRAITGGSVPIWVTEYGISTTKGYTQLQQAAIMTRLRSKLARMPDVRAIVAHTMINVSRFPVTDGEYGYGLLQGDLSPKLAWCALGGAAATRPGCPSVLNLSLGRTQERRWAAQDKLEAAVDAAVQYRNARGRFRGLRASMLRTLSRGALSGMPQSQRARPGDRADPARIYLYTDVRDPQRILLCNVSKADMSYCALSTNGRTWIYRSAAGAITAAAGAVTTTVRSSW